MRKGLAIFGLGFATGRMSEEPKVPMVKKAVYLGLGVGIGYAAAMGNQEPNGDVKEATADFLKSLKAIANDAWLDVKQEMAEAKQAATATPEDIIGEPAVKPGTEEETPRDEAVAEADVVESDDETEEGATP